MYKLYKSEKYVYKTMIPCDTLKELFEKMDQSIINDQVQEKYLVIESTSECDNTIYLGFGEISDYEEFKSYAKVKKIGG